MWSDKETSEDLLGYTVHSSLLKSVITNEKNLPITVGLYGDWGLGKSSILKILEKQLEEDGDAVVVYFDGWTFEDFDDAKMALIQGIVDALEKNQKFIPKAETTLQKFKDQFSKLKNSINWMRLLKFSVKGIVPVATAAVTGGVSMIIPTLLSAIKENRDDLSNILSEENAENFLRETLCSEDEEKKYTAVREFRKDFEKLIEDSKQGKIVVLIDDLDRCLPRHIIDYLEAIKLFLNVPGTAFVIAADKYIVSNAIKSEYKEIIEAASEDRPNLGDSYMEKFIQLPYTIPTLSPKEVETYVTLLFCQSILNKESFDKVRNDFTEFVSINKFDRYGWTNIQTILKDNLPENMGETIGFFSLFSRIIGNSLRWNPRLIKRFLNAYEIRVRLLEQSGINDSKSKFALLKLMLIEQKFIDQFKQLNTWVMSSIDSPKELIDIEKYANAETNDIADYKDWNSPDLLQIVRTEPKFSSVNMRELFWVSRDNIIDEMSGMSLISSRVKALFNKAYNATTDPICKEYCEKELSILSVVDLHDIFDLLDAKILLNPKDKKAYTIYYFCIMSEIPNAYNRLLSILSRIDVSSIPFSLGNKFKEILLKFAYDKKLQELISKNKPLMNSINGK